MNTELTDVLGIQQEPPYGVVSTQMADGTTVADIGQLAVFDGVVHIIPRHDLTDQQDMYLSAAAEDAFFTDPTSEAGWVPVVHDNQVGWATKIILSTNLNRAGSLGEAA
ncbi:hypothetical protein JWS13_17590 [Rhodococcus pseudokoreensis]|uniref:Uncharacterized protein n=1 Tax=Rhodococcus pseudokoreensis TaxID=2811421 RepID=A0A974W4P7_9NOCA|nr:hypothetical protein [Rhodococcus pseudokoreensis]QSE90303.1 hypothetical protein JWS13_17590 [Rhodococcus pseudokoreensis]